MNEDTLDLLFPPRRVVADLAGQTAVVELFMPLDGGPELDTEDGAKGWFLANYPHPGHFLSFTN